ncbi:MAG: hypothetical protein L0177_20190 [Chloroflexi bacterium]|nr:hypothetical protein [Chloroflexota bacterium]
MSKSSKPVDTHDRKVLQIARELEKKGYKVKSSVGRRPAPTKINSKAPDIEAKKGGRIRLIEVETPDSLKLNAEHLKELARYVSEREDMRLDLYVTIPRKRAANA